VFQGALLNSYFLAAVSSIAADPSRIKKIMLVKEFSHDQSMVGFAINVLGKWEQTWVDLNLPFYKK
jgi:hypothetical protein